MTLFILLAALGLALGSACAARRSFTRQAPASERSPSLPIAQASFALGKRGGHQPVRLSDRELATHIAVLGGTGSGKSRLLNQVMREHISNRRGFCLIDPAGDLCEDVLAYCARQVIETGKRSLLKRLHYLEPGNYKVTFAYDPLKFDPASPTHPEHRDSAFRAWLHTTANKIGELVQLKQGQMDFEGTPRLQRVLTNLLVATGMAVDRHGTHLPLGCALVLLNVDHPRHAEVFERVAPFLDADTLADFLRLHAYKRVEDRLRETESTINRLRAILSPIARAIFSATADTIDFRRVIREGGFLLWNLRPTEYFSQDQKITFGKLAIHEIITTTGTIPRALRRPFTLIVDEAAEFASEQLQWALGAKRKDLLSIVLAAQDLSSFRKKEGFDMAAKVLFQCRTKVVFNQEWPDDLDILARVVGTGNLDFTPLELEVERHGGYAWHRVVEVSRSANRNESWSVSSGRTVTDTESATLTEGLSRQKSWSVGKSTQTAHATSSSAGQSTGLSSGASTSQSPVVVDGQLQHYIPLAGTQRGESTAEQSSHAETSSTSQGESETHGGGEGRSWGASQGTSKATGSSAAAGTGGSEGTGVTVSYKLVPLAVVRRERQRTGKLETAVSDQLERLKQQIHGLKQRQAVVKLPDQARAFVMETMEVRDPFVSPEAQAKAVEWLKRELFQTHPYFFVPVLDPAEEDKRLAAFLATVSADTPPAVELKPTVEGKQHADVPALPNGAHRNGAHRNGQARAEDPFEDG